MNFVKFLYYTFPGRILLKFLSSRSVSKLAGMWLDHPSSRFLIKPFMKKNHINPEDYLDEDYKCFNDCFIRKIKPELRPIDPREDALIAPCDGLLKAYDIHENMVCTIKECDYSIKKLLKNDELAAKYEGGTCLVFRLCVDNYHRYCFPDNGTVENNYFIPGKLHTVQPLALNACQVFSENCREVTILNTEHFGQIAQIEVGAMLVGRIQNHPVTEFVKGQEKGMFLYGGSTVVLLLEPDKVRLPKMLFNSTNDGRELIVKQGQRIGCLN